MSTRLFAAIACLVLAGLSQANATTYNIDYSGFAGDPANGGITAIGNIIGTITTDGATSPNFTAADITGYNLNVIVVNANGAAPTVNLTGSNSVLNLAGGLVVTPTAMSFDYTANPPVPFQFSIQTASGDGFVLFNGAAPSATLTAAPNSVAFELSTLNGVTQIGLAAAPAVTPLPAALPLYGAGLGVMGLFGWRRKRKAVIAHGIAA